MYKTVNWLWTNLLFLFLIYIIKQFIKQWFYSRFLRVIHVEKYNQIRRGRNNKYKMFNIKVHLFGSVFKPNDREKGFVSARNFSIIVLPITGTRYLLLVYWWFWWFISTLLNIRYCLTENVGNLTLILGAGLWLCVPILL